MIGKIGKFCTETPWPFINKCKENYSFLFQREKENYEDLATNVIYQLRRRLFVHRVTFYSYCRAIKIAPGAVVCKECDLRGDITIGKKCTFNF